MFDMPPVCGKCHCTLYCKLNDVTLHAEGGRVVRGDVFACAKCGAEVITNFGQPYDLDPVSLDRVKAVEGAKWIELLQ